MSSAVKAKPPSRSRNLRLVDRQPKAEAPKPVGRCLNEQQLAWLRERHAIFATAEAQVRAAQADTKRSRVRDAGIPVQEPVFPAEPPQRAVRRSLLHSIATHLRRFLHSGNRQEAAQN